MAAIEEFNKLYALVHKDQQENSGVDDKYLLDKQQELATGPAKKRKREEALRLRENGWQMAFEEFTDEEDENENTPQQVANV